MWVVLLFSILFFISWPFSHLSTPQPHYMGRDQRNIPENVFVPAQFVQLYFPIAIPEVQYYPWAHSWIVLTILFKLFSETVHFYQYRNFTWASVSENFVSVAVCLKWKDVLPRRNLEDGCSLVRETKHFMLLLNGNSLFPISVLCCLLKDSHNMEKAVLANWPDPPSFPASVKLEAKCSWVVPDHVVVAFFQAYVLVKYCGGSVCECFRA